MKKLWLVLLAIALLGCPSDPNPGEQIDEYDFEIKNDGTGTGINYRQLIPVEGPDGFVITEGEEYTVTFVIEAADSVFFPSRVGGKLVYKEEGGEDQVLSGWAWSTPTPVTGSGTYRWTFKAGEKNEDGQEVAVPATTPAGAAQFFTLNAQTSDWKQYPSDYVFKIKGSIKVAKKDAPVGVLTKTADIALDFSGSGHDASKGIGNIQGEEFTKVQAAAGNGAFLRFTLTNVNVTQAVSDDGNSFGSVGNRDNLSDGTNPNPQFSVPKGTAVNSSFTLVVDVEVEVALEFVGTGNSHLFVNVWEGAVCSKVELWEYK